MILHAPALNRRRFLSGTAAVGAAAALGLPGTARAQGTLNVGFIYVGARDDFGYNQAHAEGAAAVKAMAGVTVVEEENVAETSDVQNSMQSMINFDDVSLIFPTSFGYFNPHVLEVAPKHPDVRFQHAAGLWTDSMPENIGSYFGYIGMGQYLNGIVAGHMSRTKKIGFVAAKPIPQVILNINSFLLGARAVDPTITCHVDGPKVVMETAAGRDCFICGYHADQTSLAHDQYLTGAEWNWAGVYTGMVQTVLDGGTIPNFVRGGLADGFIKMSPLGSSVSDAARAQFEATKAEILKGGFAAIRGPLNDNAGNVILTAGESLVETDIALESMGYLVEGVIGSTS